MAFRQSHAADIFPRTCMAAAAGPEWRTPRCSVVDWLKNHRPFLGPLLDSATVDWKHLCSGDGFPPEIQQTNDRQLQLEILYSSCVADNIDVFSSADVLIQSLGYENLRLIGRGSFGTLYACGHAEACHRQIILKRCRIRTENGPTALELQVYTLTSVLAEADVLKRLSHPNLVVCKRIFVAGEPGAEDCVPISDFVFELERMSQDLAAAFSDQKRRYSPGQVQACLYDVASGLGFMHQNRLAHLDLKPQNILENSHRNKLKLCDFGLAVEFCHPLPQRRHDRYKQTLWYRCPTLAAMCIGNQAFAVHPFLDSWSYGMIVLEFLLDSPFCVHTRVGSEDSEFQQNFNLLKFLVQCFGMFSLPWWKKYGNGRLDMYRSIQRFARPGRRPCLATVIHEHPTWFQFSPRVRHWSRDQKNNVLRFAECFLTWNPTLRPWGEGIGAHPFFGSRVATPVMSLVYKFPTDQTIWRRVCVSRCLVRDLLGQLKSIFLHVVPRPDSSLPPQLLVDYADVIFLAADIFMRVLYYTRIKFLHYVSLLLANIIVQNGVPSTRLLKKWKQQNGGRLQPLWSSVVRALYVLDFRLCVRTYNAWSRVHELKNFDALEEEYLQLFSDVPMITDDDDESTQTYRDMSESFQTALTPRSPTFASPAAFSPDSMVIDTEPCPAPSRNVPVK